MPFQALKMRLRISRKDITGISESPSAGDKFMALSSEKEAREIHELVAASLRQSKNDAEVVVTAPPSFAMKTKVTKTVVKSMLEGAKSSIVITF